MEKIEVKVALSINCQLGEGLHWDRLRNKLLFVDIIENTLYSFDIDTLFVDKKVLTEPIGWVLPITHSPKLLLGLKSGIAIVDSIDNSSEIEWVNRSFPNDPEQRLNDAKADRFGRIWYGSISVIDESKPVGRLARLNFTDNQLEIIDEGYEVTNGPAFNKSQTIMLHNDSRKQITYLFDIDVNTGEVLNKRIWKTYSVEEGFPDGMSFDNNEHIWIAHWGVGRVVQYNLEGEILIEVQFPVKNVTNVCFGGANLDRLFVSTASGKLGNESAEDSEFDGAIFEIFGVKAKGFENSLPII
jgi:sugar lactone lactonase YvrE